MDEYTAKSSPAVNSLQVALSKGRPALKTFTFIHNWLYFNFMMSLQIKILKVPKTDNEQPDGQKRFFVTSVVKTI